MNNMDQCRNLKSFNPVPNCNKMHTNGVKQVLFDEVIGNVYDENNNYIGKGEWKEGILQITPKQVNKDTAK